MSNGFGPAAASWSARLPGSAAWIVSDGERAHAALAHAATMKQDGRSIAATIFMPDAAVAVAALYGHILLQQAHGYDEREVLFNALARQNLSHGDVPQRDWVKLNPQHTSAAREFLASCDIWVTRSSIEMQRITALLDYVPDTILQAAPFDPSVFAPPKLFPRRRRGIVVWAPQYSREECATLAFGLEHVRAPVTILCRFAGPPFPGLHALFATAAQGAEMLADAAVIVDASPDDPGSAMALARYGVPVLTTRTSGAHEWLRPVFSYTPWNARSIHDAALTALGGSAPKPLHSHDGVAAVQAELDAIDDALPTTGPLVSIVLPTYNRRERLRKALQSVANQRYEAIEVVVVNDGGEPIADIVACFPRARLIENQRNLGVTPSVNAGIAAARGEYFGFLADDDFLQPDHVARLVDALERSGLDVAHSKEFIVHYDPVSDGGYVLRGHHIGSPAPTYYSELLVNNRIAGPSMMVRKRALDTYGLFDAEMRHGSDFELWMRLAEHHSFVFVNHVTAHVSMRKDRSQLSSVSGAETAAIMRRIYEKHPAPERLMIEANRQRAIEFAQGQDVMRSSPITSLGADDLRELQLG